MKCQHCGKEYIENPNLEFLKKLPKFMQENLKYIPNCNCLEKEQEKELDDLFEAKQKESKKRKIEKQIKEMQDFSINDSSFWENSFKTAKTTPTIELAKKYTKAFIKSKNEKVGLFLYGNVGTGKTYATSCIVNALNYFGKSVLVISLNLYLNKVTKNFGELENTMLKNIEHADLLVIDDFGAEYITEFTKDKVFALIDARYRSKKPMIITTNLVLFNKDLNDKTKNFNLSIESKFGIRTADRIADMCQSIFVAGSSLRGANTENKFKEFLNY